MFPLLDVCVYPLYASVAACSYPGDYGEEGEGDGCPGCVRPLVEWQLISRGSRPLIGQEAETDKVQEGPETCQRPVEYTRHCYNRKKKVISKLTLNMKHNDPAGADFLNLGQMKQFFVPFWN